MFDDPIKRKARNADILRRLQKGEALQDSPANTWFPERPQIKKDPALVAALYCREGHTWKDGLCQTCGSKSEPKRAFRVVE